MRRVKDQTATVDQLRALAHPLRWRILRLCRETPRTNQELAELLQVAPPTMLRHVRQLLTQGFLVAEEVRAGRHGAMERPYRATGLTRTLTLIDDDPIADHVGVAILNAHRAEVIEAGPHATRNHARGVMRLGPASQHELDRRMRELLEEFDKRADPDGENLSYFWHLIRHPPE